MESWGSVLGEGVMMLLGCGGSVVENRSIIRGGILETKANGLYGLLLLQHWWRSGCASCRYECIM